MKHPTEDSLRAYMDGELSPAISAAIGNHLSLCTACDATADGLRETANVFAGAMARMDAAEPGRWGARAGDDGDLFARTGRSGPALVRDLRPAHVPRGPAPSPKHAGPVLWRWAASIALLVAIGGSAAIASGLIGLGTDAEPPAAPNAGAAEAAPITGGGLFARPVDGVIEVVLMRTPAGSRVVVALTEDEEVLVEVEEAPAPHFTPVDENGRVFVDLADRAGIVRVAMPQGLRSATVVWQGRIVVQVAGGAVTPDGAAAEGVVLRARQ